MSSAVDLSQDLIPNRQPPKSKYNIKRRRLIITGVLLFVFGLLLPFIAEAYYNYGYKILPSFRNSYSKTLDPQASGRLKKDSGRQTAKTESFVNFDAPPDTNLKSAASVTLINNIEAVRQQRFRITGSVKRRDGTSIGGVSVSLFKNNVFLNETKTDESGKYRFSNLPPGEYEVIADTPTLGRRFAKVTIRDNGQSETANITYGVSPTPKPTGSTTPSNANVPLITPTPFKPTPTPIEMPTPTAPPTVSPTPSPSITSATPTPKPSPSPTPPVNVNVNVNQISNSNGNQASNTNAASGNETKYDKIDINYPQRIFQDKEQEITCTLEHSDIVINPFVLIQPDTNANVPVNRITNIRTIGPTITNLCKAGCRVKARARLVPVNGLILSPDAIKPEPKEYDGRLVTWNWKVKTTLKDGEAATFRIVLEFELEYENETKSLPDYWRDAPTFSVRVGLPKAIKIMSPVSIIIGLLGILGGFVGIVPGMRTEEKVEDVEIGGEIHDTAEPEFIPPVAATINQAADEVQCALYAPNEVSAGSTLAIQVFAHLAEQAEALDGLARELDAEAQKRTAQKLKKKIERGAELTFKLMIPGLELTEDEQSCRWEGEPVGVQFFVPVPDTHAAGSRFGRVTVFEKDEKLGTMSFGVKILALGQPPPIQEKLVTPMIRFESAFISYASEDKDEVYEFLQLLDALEVTYHVDVMSIAPGDRWEQKLYEFIDADDVFLLFWSEAASRSEWVLREAERANARSGTDRKNPPRIVIHQLLPPEVKLPAWLSDIHYDRKWAGIIENARRKKEERQRRENET